MFPRMRQRLGSALLENLDLLVEFSTLGEYRLMDPEAALAARPGQTSAEPAARPPLPTGNPACSARHRHTLPATSAARRQACLSGDAP